jgi:transposase
MSLGWSAAPHCGFKTARVHDTRRLRAHDLPSRGRPTTLEWMRHRFVCASVPNGTGRIIPRSSWVGEPM